MNSVIKLVIGIPLIGIFSLWAAYMFVGLVVVGLASLQLTSLPGCSLLALESGDLKIPPCPSILSYSIELLFIIALLIAIGIFSFLIKIIYKKQG